MDWAERHHDLCLLDRGAVLAKHRSSDGLAGVTFRRVDRPLEEPADRRRIPPPDTNTPTTWPNWSTALDIFGVIAEYFGPK